MSEQRERYQTSNKPGRKIFTAGSLEVELDFDGKANPLIYITALDTEGEDKQTLIVFGHELEALLLAIEQAKTEIWKG